MRISDWSSDVCSSDLMTSKSALFSGRPRSAPRTSAPQYGPVFTTWIADARLAREGVLPILLIVTLLGRDLSGHRLHRLGDALEIPCELWRWLRDRKSAVWGTGLSGRGEHGGRR